MVGRRIFDDLDFDLGLSDIEAGKLRPDVLSGRLDRPVERFEAAWHRRFEGDLDLAAVDTLGVPAAVDLVELVADPDVGRAGVG